MILQESYCCRNGTNRFCCHIGPNAVVTWQTLLLPSLNGAFEGPSWHPGSAAAQQIVRGECIGAPLVAQTNQDFIVEIELLDPPKGPSLAWLEGTAPSPPPRYARVTVIRGSKADCMDYKVKGAHAADRPATDDISDGVLRHSLI